MKVFNCTIIILKYGLLLSCLTISRPQISYAVNTHLDADAVHHCLLKFLERTSG